MLPPIHRTMAKRRIPKIGDRIKIGPSHPWKPFRGKQFTVCKVIELRNGKHFLGFQGGGVKTGSFTYVKKLPTNTTEGR